MSAAFKSAVLEEGSLGPQHVAVYITLYLSLCSTERLMNHDATIGQGPSFAFGSGAQQKGTHAGRHAKTNRGNIARDVLLL